MENQVLDNELTINETDSEVKWAGFWIRVGASFVDFAVYLPLIGLNIYKLYVLKSMPLQLFVALLMILYKPLMEYRYGATLGKLAVKIKVVNKDFEKITLPQSVIRYIPWLIGQVFSIYATILLFQHPDFISTKGWIEVGYLQNELVSPAYNMIGSFILIISCIVVGFNKTKQGLNDMIANTYCIYKES